MSEPRGSAERRTYERFEFPSAVQVRCLRASAIPFLTKPFDVTLQNVSASGVRMASAGAIKVGDAFKGTISIPETRDSVRFAGKVAWTRKIAPSERWDKARTIFGLSFQNMDTGDQAKLESMRKWFTSDRYKTTRRVVRR